MVSAKRTRHSVYDLKYHFVWVPKYRKLVLEDEVGDTLEEVLTETAKRYDIDIDTLEVMPDHVHLFASVPPKYSPSKVVQIMKSISARKLFERHPEIKEKLWGGALWADGYFVRSVGDKVTKKVIRRYIKSQHEDQLRFDL